jgi:hypothetical protein
MKGSIMDAKKMQAIFDRKETTLEPTYHSRRWKKTSDDKEHGIRPEGFYDGRPAVGEKLEVPK